MSSPNTGNQNEYNVNSTGNENNNNPTNAYGLAPDYTTIIYAYWSNPAIGRRETASSA